MTKKEKISIEHDRTIQENIELTFDFIRAMIDNPELAKQLPDKCEIAFSKNGFSPLSDKKFAKKQLIKVSHTFDIVNRKKSQLTA